MNTCSLCTVAPSSEEGELIWLGDDCRVILVNDADLPGFCRVIWNHHVAEMTDLSYGEREHLMTLVFAVEQAIRQVMKPDKINLAALGNMVPHIHWHVIPRYRDDAFFPGSAWSQRTQETSASAIEARQLLAKNLSAAVKSAITALR
ncbi:HIT family protein [Polynucleobacter sp. TUM22923]|uniref:HIT family protein n=1 Tax=Polynucleobacter sp. TUM22923 TaxID=3022126 RepID=UPI0025724942|nr:HIT family protein [Polynucleobacter sp. TUM22923]